jgi:hypothetical protein
MSKNKPSDFDFDKQLLKLPPHIQNRVRAACRPSTYDETWCKKLILLMSNGFSLTQTCAELGIGRSTFYEQLHKQPELADAYKKAKVNCQAYFDDRGLLAIMGEESPTQSQFCHHEAAYKRRFAAAEHGYALPDLDQGTDADKFKYINKAIADERVTIEAAEKLTNTIKTQSEHLKLEQLEQRLNDLEQMND